MSRTRIIFYGVISILMVISAFLLFIIISNNSEKNIDQQEMTENATEINTTTLELTEEVTIEKSITSTPSTTTLNTTPKAEEIKVDLPVVKPETTQFTFDPLIILAAHNTIRGDVGIAQLTYSKTLARDAQKWSDKLQYNDCEIKHDPKTNYGENLYWASQTGNIEDGLIATPKGVVNSWAAEKVDYNYAENSCVPGKQCGHYTQIVWEETSEVGCGVSVCRNGNSQKEIWVCRYNPPGNYIGEKPY